jgi:hypothetical protein
MDVRNPNQSLPLIPLKPGTYYWTIRASNGDGKDISAERPASFIVDRPEPFPAPANRTPETNYRLWARDMQNSREIVFAWNAVSGANRYILTIYATDTGRHHQVFQTEPLSALTYTFTNFSLLQGENFSWSVEAVLFDAPAIRIEQRGTPGENTFVVDTPVPTIVIDNPGRLYGE